MKAFTTQYDTKTRNATHRRRYFTSFPLLPIKTSSETPSTLLIDKTLALLVCYPIFKAYDTSFSRGNKIYSPVYE